MLVVSYWSSQKCQFWILSSCSGKGKHINSCADSDTHRSTFYHCPSSPMGFFYWVREFSLLPSIIHCSQWLATGDDTASSCFVLGVTDVLLGETNQTNSMVTSQACWEPIQRARAFSADECGMMNWSRNFGITFTVGLQHISEHMCVSVG